MRCQRAIRRGLASVARRCVLAAALSFAKRTRLGATASSTNRRASTRAARTEANRRVNERAAIGTNAVFGGIGDLRTNGNAKGHLGRCLQMETAVLV
ncbi:hypothetical protein CNO08_01100 [Lysobacter capsici]|nr:hypothetical protein CNO08_01100 [Lysobacter capsici]